MNAPKRLTKIILGITFFCLTTLNLFAQLPAFPGAEGYGKYTIGGRGGQVIEVTNLNDSGPGSFRAACEASGPRVVIFKVGGRIDITGPTIKITDPNITIAGQTAPGGGVMLTRETIDRPILEIDTDEVIIRYIRFRRSTSYRSGNNADNVWVNSGNNIIFDHCSFAWSSDGNLDIANYDGQPGRPPQVELSNITIQYCIFTNSYGGNNKTFLVSRGPTNISWFRNAWLSTATRNPSVSTPVNEAPTWDCYYEHVNNFHYDYTNGPSYNNNDPSVDAGIYYVNVIKNWAKENGNPSPTIANTNITSRRWLRASTVGNGMEIYVEDNITPYRPDDSYDQWEIGQNGGGQANNDVLIPENLRSYTVNSTPIMTDNVPLWDATDIWDNLRTHVGASLPERDAEDTRAVNDVDTGDSTEDKVNNVFPIISGGTPYTDTDIDGMPDFWETSEFGDLSSDGVVDTDGDGYTDLEEYLNQSANGQIPDVPAESVEVTPSTATLNVPETITLTTTFTPSSTTNQSGTWTSSNPSIATVTNGLVTSISEGNTTITFTSNDGGFTDTAEITVTNIVIPLSSVTIDPNDITIEVGENSQLTTTFVPSDTTDTTGIWTSSDDSVATVDENGNITGITVGQVDITYTSTVDAVTDSATVTVIDTFYGTYEFYNANTDVMLMNITGDTDINLAGEGNEVNFRSIPEGGDQNAQVESVRVDWTGPTSGTWIESGPIYAGLPNGHVGFNFEPYVVEQGTYNFTITYFSQDGGSGNVVATDTFALTFFFSSVPVANAGPDQDICEGETTTLTASGGPNFLWNNGETMASIDVSPTVTTTYTVSVFDDEGNTDEDSVTITVNAIPVADAGEDQTICQGETITLTASGGDAYLWNTGETTASIDVSPTSDTIYDVEVISNNCSSTDTVTVSVSEAPNLTVSDDVVLVEGESTTLGVSGSDNYLWSTGETTAFITVSPMVTTTYTVTSLSANDCLTTEDILVTVIPEVIADAGTDTTICSGENVTLIASGGTNYLWDTGETTAELIVSPTLTTTYTVTVTDDYGYSDSDSVTVTVNETPDITVSEDVYILDGETVTLTASGGDNYQWNTGETSASIVVTPDETTTYTVISTAVGGCADIEQVTVNIIPDVVADAGEDATICSGESITLNASGGVSYTWDTGDNISNPTVSPSVTTTYTVTVEDAFGYIDTDSVTITVNETPNVTISNDVTIIEGESVTLNADGAVTYEWNTSETTSAITVSPTQTTTYTVTGTSNTCSAQAQVTVTVEPLFEASAGADARVCENDSYEIVLTATEGDSYLWNTGATTQSITVSPISTSTYTVTVTQGSQEDTDEVTVYVDPNPNVVITNGDSIDIMSGDFVTLSATGANTYEWNNGATQPNIAVSPTVTTTYEVRGYIGDCYDEKQVTVNVIPDVEADAGEDVDICLGETATLTASGGDEYVWSTGQTTQTIQVSPNETTEYTVTVFNAVDFDEDTVTVYVDTDCEEDVDPVEGGGDPLDFDFSVFPNPASNYVNIRLEGSTALSRIYLYDITGKLIHSEIISNEYLSTSTTRQIDVSKLHPGMYYIKMVDVRQEISKKLMIK
ncbi:Ig-like domain-containing protein [uncultured Winogradskyella sp.]|uniref:T9SS type A sorting domain-containing protein n=1 Tax=uncultured Winogradskyella sp. TaxID=395353 RepID=UPI00260DC5E7|nr:Ig-like domain-containing protein [uncultured Winogradskyella sp.]